MYRSLFLFVGLLLSGISAFSQSQSVEQVLQVAKSKNLAGERQWQKLMHFEPQMFGLKTYSQIDSMNFFMSPEGVDNLEAELVADIRAIWAAPEGPEENLPQCRFPARYRFLKKHLAPEISKFPDRPCPRFEKYLKALHGESVSLVFSSFYLNNPSSAFGHTFVRINKEPAADGKRYELLDYGINYAANADTDNAFLFGFKGLFGMFPGKFTSIPYYMKVREYNNSESRDLWEYELTSSPEIVDLMIAHMWELGPTYIDYWYLTENCSYHMLTVLEAADPSIDVVSTVKKWVIPSDTVKDVWNIPGLVKSFHYRPSIRTEFFYRLRKLSREDQQLLKTIVDRQDFPVEFQKASDERRQNILDAAMDYMDFKYPAQTMEKSPEADFKHVLLSLRSAIDLTTAPLKIPVPEREQSQLGHGSRKFSVGYRGSQNGNDSTLIGYKLSLHGRTDLITGYPEYAAITMGDFQFSYSRLRSKLELDDFSLIEVMSYSPLSLFSRALSWRIKFGVEHLRDENCLGCHAVTLSGGAGYTLEFSQEPMFTWFFGLRGGLFSTPYGTGNRLLAGIGPSTEFRVRWTDQLISTLEGWYRRDLNSIYPEFQEVNFTTQYSWNKSWSVQILGSDVRYDRMAQAQLLYFY